MKTFFILLLLSSAVESYGGCIPRTIRNIDGSSREDISHCIEQAPKPHGRTIDGAWTYDGTGITRAEDPNGCRLVQFTCTNRTSKEPAVRISICQNSIGLTIDDKSEPYPYEDIVNRKLSSFGGDLFKLPASENDLSIKITKVNSNGRIRDYKNEFLEILSTKITIKDDSKDGYGEMIMKIKKRDSGEIKELKAKLECDMARNS